MVLYAIFLGKLKELASVLPQVQYLHRLVGGNEVILLEVAIVFGIKLCHSAYYFRFITTANHLFFQSVQQNQCRPLYWREFFFVHFVVLLLE